MSTQLPPPKDDQVFYHLTALEAGTLGAREHFSVEGGDSAKVTIIPTLSFLIQNASLGRKMLFDLGIRKKMNELSPGTLAILPLFAPCKADPDIIDSLKNLRESIGPKDIDHIFISHVHWDHIGDHSPFVNAKFILGQGSKALINDGYPKGEDSGYLQDTVPNDRTQWLDFRGWSPIGPFERGYDFFGDGSLFIIDSTGHLPGHINILLRTDASGKWAYLAADSASDYRLITGEKEIGHFHDPTGAIRCLHVDEATAKEHIKKIQSLPKNVTVLISHDHEWRERVKEI